MYHLFRTRQKSLFPHIFKSSFGHNLDLNYFKTRGQFVYWALQSNFTGLWSHYIQYPMGITSKKIMGIVPSTTLINWSSFVFEIGLVFIFLSISKTLYYLVFKPSKITLSRKYFLFFTGIVILILMQTILVSNAFHIWHYYIIYPFYTICMVYSFYEISQSRTFTTYCVIAIAFLNLNNYSRFASSLINETPLHLWSNKIDELIAVVKNRTEKCVLINWGMEDQLVCFVQQDRFFQANFTNSPHKPITNEEKQHEMKVFNNKFINNRNLDEMIFVILNDNLKNDSFEKCISTNNLIPETIKEIKENNGNLVYTIIKLKKNDRK